jgi:hypothetical protein
MPTTDLLPVFTIGHSTRPIPDFVALLRAGDVRLVVDIRRMPRTCIWICGRGGENHDGAVDAVGDGGHRLHEGAGFGASPGR